MFGVHKHMFFIVWKCHYDIFMSYFKFMLQCITKKKEMIVTMETKKDTLFCFSAILLQVCGLCSVYNSTNTLSASMTCLNKGQQTAKVSHSKPVIVYLTSCTVKPLVTIFLLYRSPLCTKHGLWS